MAKGDSTIKKDDPHKDGSRASIETRRLTLTALAVAFLIIVGLGTWFGLDRIEQRTRENVGGSLEVVVDTTRGSLREWFRTERQFAQRMAGNPKVIRATESLLATSRTREALLESQAFQDLRSFFALLDNSPGKRGVFLISPDELNLFSMRDSNVGVRNLIAEQRPERLQQVLTGKSALVPPVISDVPLGAEIQDSSSTTPTMFVATPVKSSDGKVIAILAVRLDPTSDFTRILQGGRLGDSGESYALDADGWMLSESRFDDTLTDIGLLKPGERSILTVRIADPGHRLSPQAPADFATDDISRPLTLMAASVARGKSDVNFDGYRDYRGVPVLGAWQWDSLLGIGITSEIDEIEALAVFASTRNIVATILALTVVLAFALAAYLVKLDEREAAARRLAEEKTAVELAAGAKTEFLAHMSHEIRTPLNAIIGFSQLLRRDDSLDEDTRRTVQTIERSGNHLLLLINDVLEMSKIEAGQLTLNRESVGLRNIAEDMREMMGLKAKQKGLEFELVWDEALPDYVDIDSGKFRQIVLNLLSNAVKFTDSGFVRLTLAAADEPQISSATSLRVVVTDSGAGISQEDQQKLFAAFYQSESGRRQQGGTGLGLAISAKFAKFLGGDLALTSEIGKGTTFTLRLPLEASSNLASKVAADLALSGGISGPHVIGLDLAEGETAPRILIAEDQPANRELMERLLGEVGFELHFVEDGRAAVEQVDEWKPDFVWMDLKMPYMNGDEATEIIREKHGKDLPVVALTASALTVERDSLMQRGFSEVLMKPINPDEIFGTMADFIGVRYLTKEEQTAAIESEQSAFGRLVELPDDLKKKFRGAIDLGDLSTIETCVEEIRAIDPALADALKEPLANFAFGSIAETMGESA